uniref:Uncharacterized protein n=1 Tax=Arundo donax TaxID=35708 RepID=A0A0A8YPC9_ARUDO
MRSARGGGARHAPARQGEVGRPSSARSAPTAAPGFGTARGGGAALLGTLHPDGRAQLRHGEGRRGGPPRHAPPRWPRLAPARRGEAGQPSSARSALTAVPSSGTVRGGGADLLSALRLRHG